MFGTSATASAVSPSSMAQPKQENKPAVEDDEFEEFNMDGEVASGRGLLQTMYKVWRM